VPEPTELGQLDVLDFPDVAAYGFVKVNDFPVRNRKGSKKLNDVLRVLSHLAGTVWEGAEDGE